MMTLEHALSILGMASVGMTVIGRRQQQAIMAAASQVGQRYPGNMAGMKAQIHGGYAAAGNQGAYATANSSTWTDITNTSFTLTVMERTWFEYRLIVTGHISAGAAKGYVRGNIVGFDVTASPWFQSGNVENGFMWYMPFTSGPIDKGAYTVKLQAATDANTTSLTVDQFFHQIVLMGT